MIHIPLARKYRPSTFEELVGQEVTAKILVNGIKLSRIPAALIFSGVRGVGKTSLARLYAKALNCENGITPSPCGICENCLAIARCHHEDVYEIDGASHNGVDEIRSLKESIAYTPQRSRYKVYIIDEVHMLSNSAFNALLKTLEEPPKNVIFIFATTELIKVPETVLGRCQTFHLKKIPQKIIQDRMIQILSQENITFDQDAITLIGREGRGSLRDALTLLDQAIALGQGQIIFDEVKPLVGYISLEKRLALLEHLLKHDIVGCLEIIESFDQEGIDFLSMTEDLACLVRHSSILKACGAHPPDFLKFGEITGEECGKLQKIGAGTTSLALTSLFQKMVSCRESLNGSDLDRFVFENFMMEWHFMSGEPAAQFPLTPPCSGKGKEESLRENYAVGFSQEIKALGEPAALVLGEPAAQFPLTPPCTGTKNPLESFPRKFPETWENLVEQWKIIRPIQARKLEEVRPIEYSLQKIKVSVDSNGMLGYSLLKKDVQLKLSEEFKKLFGFTGSFEAEPFAEQKKAPNIKETKNSSPSILEVKEKNLEEKKQKIQDEILGHPLTKAIIQEFDGQITKINHNL